MGHGIERHNKRRTLITMRHRQGVMTTSNSGVQGRHDKKIIKTSTGLNSNKCQENKKGTGRQPTRDNRAS